MHEGVQATLTIQIAKPSGVSDTRDGNMRPSSCDWKRKENVA
jgi:hypothetical protein